MLRFENLSGDPSLDWTGRGISEILIRQLGAAPLAMIERAQEPFTLHPASAPGISSELSAAQQTGASRIITGYITAASGKLTVWAIERDSDSQKIVLSAAATGANSGDLFSIAGALAHKFRSGAIPSSGPGGLHNLNALREYSIAVETAGAAALEHYQLASAADPNFGDAYRGWARTAAALGNRAELERALSLGITRGAALAPLDLANLQLQMADLRQDRAARLAALGAIVKLAPSDAANFRALADTEFAAHRFGPAIEHYQQAIGLVPDSADLLNLLTYARLFGGDYAGALASVRDYQKRKPDDPNAIDSEGDIHFYYGRFADAERAYLQAYAKAPNFQGGGDGWKAARARLMTGDTAGATQLFQNFEDGRVKAADASAGFRAAEWRYLTGDRADGIARMAAAGDTARDPDVRSLCYTQAAIWEAAAGHVADTVRYSGFAFQLARPATVANAVIARFVAQPPAAAAEWTARAEHSFNGSGSANLRRVAVAYAHLLARQSAEALAEWRTIYEASVPTDQAAAFLFAKAAIGAGRTAEAAPIVKTNPIPASTPVPSWECLYFPAIFEWRGDEGTLTKLGGTPTLTK